jgi:hypothetical protein
MAAVAGKCVRSSLTLCEHRKYDGGGGKKFPPLQIES